MATRAPSLRGATGQLARATAAASRHSALGAAAAAALRRLDVPGVSRSDHAAHPLTPAALRIERARSRRNGETADQTAVTVWFGQGPSLPVPGGGDAARSAMRIGSGLLGAAALAALTAIAARREEQRARVIDAPASAARIS